MKIYPMDKTNRLAQKMMELCAEYVKKECDAGKNSNDATSDVFIAIARFVPSMVFLVTKSKEGQRPLYNALLRDMEYNRLLLEEDNE